VWSSQSIEKIINQQADAILLDHKRPFSRFDIALQ